MAKTKPEDTLQAAATEAGANDTLQAAATEAGANDTLQGDGWPDAAFTAGTLPPARVLPATAAPEPTPATLFTAGAVIDTRYFPAPLLANGHQARRASWAPGHHLLIARAGGRSGQKYRLMTTGSRAGQVEWKPQNIADELVADDWQAILTHDMADDLADDLADAPLPEDATVPGAADADDQA